MISESRPGFTNALSNIAFRDLRSDGFGQEEVWRFNWPWMCSFLPPDSLDVMLVSRKQVDIGNSVMFRVNSDKIIQGTRMLHNPIPVSKRTLEIGSTAVVQMNAMVGNSVICIFINRMYLFPFDPFASATRSDSKQRRLFSFWRSPRGLYSVLITAKWGAVFCLDHCNVGGCILSWSLQSGGLYLINLSVLWYRHTGFIFSFPACFWFWYFWFLPLFLCYNIKDPVSAFLQAPFPKERPVYDSVEAWAAPCRAVVTVGGGGQRDNDNTGTDQRES